MYIDLKIQGYRMYEIKYKRRFEFDSKIKINNNLVYKKYV